MARGAPIKRELIGHSLYGAINGTKHKWFTSIIDQPQALKYAEEELGMLNPKAYPIFKDENRRSIKTDGDPEEPDL